MAASSLFEMLTFSFSGELPLEQVSERDQLILSVMDNMQRIINCRAGTLAHLPDYGLPDLSMIHQGMTAGIHGLIHQIEETLLRCEPRLSQLRVELQPQPRPGHLNYLIYANFPIPAGYALMVYFLRKAGLCCVILNSRSARDLCQVAHLH